MGPQRPAWRRGQRLEHRKPGAAAPQSVLKVKSRIPADSYPFFCSPAELPGRGKEVGVSMF